MEKKESTRLKLNNWKKIWYEDLLEWLKSLSVHERWNFIIDLIIDIKFIEYDESEPCNI